MTMRELAAELGISTTAIYKAAKAHGTAAADLRDDAGMLTDEAADTIRAWFTRRTTAQPSAKLDELAAEVAQLKEALAQAETQAQEQQRTIDALQQRLSDAVSERDYLRHALDEAQQTHRQAMEGFTATMTAFAPSLPAPKKPSRIRAWLDKLK